MDLTILHILEAFREGSGAWLNSFFYEITELFDKEMIPMILAAIYWCLSKEFGTYLLLGYNWNRLLNGFMKVTVCAYRPWIRDPSLIPDSDALTGATGYSFPSGHSMNAATLCGGIGIRKDVKMPLRIGAWVIVILVAFSRLYMTVHTPQDVLCGVIIGSFVMYMAYRLMPVINNAPNRDIITSCISLLLAVAIAVYSSLKSYPVDYDSEGQILVDGAKMAADTFKGVGWNLGFFVGWIVEKRFVKFTTDVSLSAKVTRFIFGMLGYYFLNYAIVPLVKSSIGGNAGIIAGCFVQMIYIVLLVPACIKAFENATAGNDGTLNDKKPADISK